MAEMHYVLDKHPMYFNRAEVSYIEFKSWADVLAYWEKKKDHLLVMCEQAPRKAILKKYHFQLPGFENEYQNSMWIIEGALAWNEECYAAAAAEDWFNHSLVIMTEMDPETLLGCFPARDAVTAMYTKGEDREEYNILAPIHYDAGPREERGGKRDNESSISAKSRATRRAERKITYDANGDSDSDSVDYDIDPEAEIQDGQGFAGLVVSKMIVLTCNYKTMVATVKSTSTHSNTKVMSVALFLFPWLSPWMQKFRPISYENARNVLPNLMPVATANAAAVTPEELIAVTAYCMCGMAYSNEATRVAQVMSRVKAALARTSWKSIDIPKIVSIMGTLVIDFKDLSNEVIAMLGRVLATDSNMRYKAAIKEKRLAPYDVYSLFTVDTDFVPRLFTQMRLIYQNLHSQSLIFGIAVIDEVEVMFRSSGQQFVQEIEAAIRLKKRILNHPYIALVDSQPDEITTKKYARLVLAGLLFQSKCLAGTPEEAKWKDYSINKIKESIPQAEDVDLIKNFIDAIPTRKVSSLARFLENLSLNMALRFTDTKSQAERDELYHYLINKNSQCNWVLYETRVRKAQSHKKYLDETVTIIKRALDEKCIEITSQASVSREINDIRVAHSRILEWKAAQIAKLQVGVSLESLLTSATGRHEREARQDVINQLSEVYTTIKNGVSMADLGAPRSGRMLYNCVKAIEVVWYSVFFVLQLSLDCLCCWFF
uniref:Uncharacterized protein n=1 Tax=Daphnia magna TaxID=35525 RepID=A0A0P4X4Z4_9CRUS